VVVDGKAVGAVAGTTTKGGKPGTSGTVTGTTGAGGGGGGGGTTTTSSSNNVAAPAAGVVVNVAGPDRAGQVGLATITALAILAAVSAPPAVAFWLRRRRHG
jgi:hypothetical protein